ncbi:hypothetical protein [Flavimaricola marinus]|uniref:MORN repeat variant n=1 Tax=Flavimaricola marinus TaxID=1819565 RepID=A0A238LKH2_9RHOB|nr:hypothetical protein [Flavimaricola marinus]SMY09370.1 hypothetical protein LOM8899_03536 [Flavimaricola marinus]
MIRYLAPLMLFASPVAAQSVSLPGGCEAYVTVQKRGCTVSTLFRCEADPEGHQRRMDFNEDGLTYAGMIDFETRWIESFYAEGAYTDRLAPNPVDPASFSDLIETGYDDWDFGTISDPFAETVYRGYDRLTGVVVVVDGVTLEQTEFDVVAYDTNGNELWQTVGNEFIHRDWRTFLSGTRTITTPTEVFETDGRPVEFAFPGEDGFQSSEPRYDCGVMLSKGGTP